VHELPAFTTWIPADNALHEKDLSVQVSPGLFKENGKGGEINE